MPRPTDNEIRAHLYQVQQAKMTSPGDPAETGGVEIEDWVPSPEQAAKMDAERKAIAERAMARMEEDAYLENEWYEREARLDREAEPILCGCCTGEKFSLRWRGHQLLATCVNCGAEESLCDG